MKTKKIIIAVLAASMALSAFSCGDSENKSESESSSSSEETTTAAETTETTEAAETTTEASSEDSTDEENPLGSTVDINDFIETDSVTPPLWKVTDNETGKTMYLLGTIHMLPVGVEYPENLLDIYKDCDAIAVEYDTVALANDANQLMEFSQGFLYNDGTKVSDHVSEETYNKAKDYFTSIGSYTEMLDQYTASYWMTLLDSFMLLRLENIEQTGTDAFFISKAMEDEKEIINIEELSDQINALNAYSDGFADYELGEYIDNIDDVEGYAESYSELYNAWAKGEEIELDAEEEIDELPEDLTDDYAKYKEIIYTNRNKKMADRAAEIIKGDKTVLFMVGAGHYSDEDGVDNLLEGMGFTVEKIA